jgi:SAM-dependent methyltransferase
MVKPPPLPTFLQIDRDLNYGREHINHFLKKCVPFNSVLDIGAGKGTDLLLAKNLNEKAQLYALECYEPNIKLLRKNQINVFNINIEQEPIPLPNESIDVILTNQFLEHTKEIFWIFHEISRILTPSGKLIIGVPNLASFHNRILLGLGLQPTSLKTHSAHVRGFTKSDLLKFLECCFPKGYILQDFGGSNFYPFPPGLAQKLVQILPNMGWGIFFLFEKSKKYQHEFIDYPLAQKLETPFYLGY